MSNKQLRIEDLIRIGSLTTLICVNSHITSSTIRQTEHVTYYCNNKRNRERVIRVCEHTCVLFAENSFAVEIIGYEFNSRKSMRESVYTRGGKLVISLVAVCGFQATLFSAQT